MVNLPVLVTIHASMKIGQNALLLKVITLIWSLVSDWPQMTLFVVYIPHSVDDNSTGV